MARPYLSKNDDLYKVAISAPVYDASDLVGVIAASITTESTWAIEAEESLARDLTFWGTMAVSPVVILVGTTICYQVVRMGRGSDRPVQG